MMRAMSSGSQFAVLGPQVAPQGAIPAGGVDELDLPLALRAFAVGEHPDIGGDAGVVEHVQGQGDDRFQPVVLDDPAADIALALTGVAGEEGRTVVNLGDTAAEGRVGLHLAEHVDQEHHLAITGAGDQAHGRVVAVLDNEARVAHAIFAAQEFQVPLPAFAVGRI